MGASSALDFARRYLVPPDSPPELASPGAISYSSRSSPSSDQVVWDCRFPSGPPLPMSSYDKGVELAEPRLHHRPESPSSSSGQHQQQHHHNQQQQQHQHQHQQRQNQQKLPSLSSLFGHLRSPPDRSPLDHHTRLSPGSFVSSSFPPMASPPVSQPRSTYDVKLDPRSLSAVEASPLLGRSAEYSLGSSYRDGGPDHPHHQQGSSSSSSRTGRRPRTETAAAAAAPPTISSPPTSSSAEATKDGLGPKIWTGTHFLPRFVRRAEVPGEGMCYFYDDGSHCKTVIDGETVNAHWGVTKAGKPRKRLAIACVTCREKKIKCDPDYPRCVQCEKFGRVCKFKNANKRLKMEGEYQPAQSQPVISRRLPPEMLPSIPDDVLSQACRTDPYRSDPESIGAVLTHFFGQIDNTIIMRFFPEKAFRSWVAATGSAHHQEKSPEDLMLLYAVLAVGVTLSGGPRHIAHEYAQVAHYAQKKKTPDSFPCLQLVQSRILLAVYHVSTCRVREAAELISSAASAAVSLQLNREIDTDEDVTAGVYPLGMNVVGYCEARRRTMWSLFMLERINTVLPNRPVTISADDIYVRLPADSESFEKQVEPSTMMPLFDPDESVASRQADNKPSGMAGYLVEMVHIWTSCRAAVSRMASRPGPCETSNVKARALAIRARDWYDSLPPRLVFGGSNLESAAFSGKVGSFLTMHLLYHHAMIHLNRYQRCVSRLPNETRVAHLHESRDHALSILEMTNCLDRILRVRPTILSTSPPTLSETIVTAIDVLTACGPMASINELIQSLRVGKTAVDGAARTWEHSQFARDVIDLRLQKMMRVYHSQGSRPASPADGYRVVVSADEPKEQRHLRWHIPEPMERLYPLEMDVMKFPYKIEAHLLGSNGPVHAVAYSASAGTYILTGSSDRSIRLYKPLLEDGSRQGRLIQTYAGHGYEVLSIDVSSDNERFVSGGGDRAVYLWDVATATTTRRFGGENAGRIHSVRFAGEAQSVVVSGGFDTVVRLWDVRSRSYKPIQSLSEAKDAITCIAVRGPDVVASSVDGRVRSYDVRMGRCVTDVFAASVTSVALTRDARAMLVGSLDSRLRLMDRDNGACLRTFSHPEWRNEGLRLQSLLGAKEKYALVGDDMSSPSSPADGYGRIWAWDLLSGKLAAKLDVPWGPPGYETRKKVIGKDGKEKTPTNVISCMAWTDDGWGDHFCVGGTSGVVTVFGPS
ncbi:hypothetical protein CP532_5988 [Ophiocordyceps camponoti-leonardi (nom. inval.)]|nr:hypothetical protein CP532_5988 [Ophiocordyceps camponoti-leonardi (nom. inval.)]